MLPDASTTIAAIATPYATGGLGVLRLSGPGAKGIAGQVVATPYRASVAALAGYQACYCHFEDADGEIDNGVALFFESPKSYTGEDVVELTCHGGRYILKRLLRALLAAGAVPAQPGEFTKRAFLNGKLDLSQAEGVAELIAADGKDAFVAAQRLQRGTLSHAVDRHLEALTRLLAHLTAWIDFPEEEVPAVELPAMERELSSIRAGLDTLRQQFDQGKLLRRGVDTVITGAPNVGKSTLMNLLVGSERSIVTDTAGTTRDVIEETVALDGLLLRLSDTAGLRETAEEIEIIGVRLAKQRLAEAQLVLAVLDGTRRITGEEAALLRSLKGRPAVVILNKSDRPLLQPADDIAALGFPCVVMSAQTGEGQVQLRETVRQVLGFAPQGDEAFFLVNERQYDVLTRSLELIDQAAADLRKGVTLDAVTLLLEQAADTLLEIRGERVSERMLDEVFSTFCVGK